MRDIQVDTLFDGRLVCRQYRKGYRYSIDSVLLAHYPKIKSNERILDLGTGTGVIGLILCYRYRQLDISITGIELQTDLVDLALKNITSNDFETIFSIISGDICSYRSLVKPESYSLIISNPPFYRAGSGRLNAHPESVIARHQNEAGITPFVDAAAFALQNRGRAVFIYPADRTVEMVRCLVDKRLNPKTMQFIYSYPQAEAASLVIVEAVKNGGADTKVERPLYIFQDPGADYTPSVQSMFASSRMSPDSDAD